jgi:hypothetical protein
MNEMETRFQTLEGVIGDPPINTKQLNLSPFMGTPVTSSDVGTYTCHDTISGESLSILLVEGVV